MSYRVMAIQETGEEILVASQLITKPTPEMMQKYQEEHPEWWGFEVETHQDWWERQQGR